MREEIELTRRAMQWLRRATPQDIGSPSVPRAKHDERSDEREPRRSGEHAYAAIDGRHVGQRARAQTVVLVLFEGHVKRAQARREQAEEIIETRGRPTQLSEQALAIADHRVRRVHGAVDEGGGEAAHHEEAEWRHPAIR